MTSSPSIDNLQLEEVYSKIHDERKCVTTKALALEMGISRSEAASLLEAVPYYQLNNDHSEVVTYDVVRCVWDDSKDGKCVAKLQKSQLEINPKTSQKPNTCQSNKNPIHSLAININNHGSTSPQSAHAYTMTLLFNALEDGSLMDKIQNDYIVQPAEEVHIENQETLRRRRIDAMNNKGKGGASSSTAAKSNNMSNTANKRNTSTQKKTSKNKMTTAASFFGGSTTSSKKSNSNPNNKTKKVTASLKEESIATSTDQNEKENIVKSKNDNNQQPSNRKTTSIKSSSISSSSTKKQRITQKGNADDFIGDEDEDEDFIQEEKERKERLAEQERKISKRHSKQRNQKIVVSNNADEMDMDTDNNDGGNVKTGAMDAFAKTTTASKKKESDDDGLSQKGRKRRKQVMEEKTYIDDNGFFRTETVAVWKDVEEEEEDELEKRQVEVKSKAPAPKKKIRNTKGMKQQGLAGFFMKKK